ncbi:MAG: type III-A CRISPR-associated protein Cas10/Csm1 [Bacteroidales bacterium]|jgi:CRISPR-associated protein Csm1|nr:type III-A CRISPR-associated protein Cas10/Csm1 [Bacteroidales bacterium]MCI2134261.1 type III-A CRISPR-associated protein Cas10/Csm1 [Bacteroidales bacterium]
MGESIRKQIYLKAIINQIADVSNQEDAVIKIAHSFLDSASCVEVKDLISEAERLAIGSRCMNKERTANPWDKNRRMISLMEGINSDNYGNYMLPDVTLTISKDCFPRKFFDKKPDYKRLHDEFVSELVKIGDFRFDTFCRTLLQLVKKYASFVPASDIDDRDISLYDKAKATAAIALCLYDWSQESEREANPFILVGGDFSGIQSYIYQITSKYAAKNLKGRSFYLKLLSDATVRYLLQSLELHEANIVYDSGGSFYIIAPNTKKAKSALLNAKKNLEKKYFETHGTALFLALDYVEISKQDLFHEDEEHNLSVVWGNLFKKREQQKFSKFSRLVKDDYDSFFKPQLSKTPQFDAVTGEEIKGNATKSEDGSEQFVTSSLNYTQRMLGTTLKTTEQIIASQVKINELDGNTFSIEPADLGYKYYFITSDTHITSPVNMQGGTVIALNGSEHDCDFLKSKSKFTNASFCFDFYGGNQNNGLTFDKLCEHKQREFARLGVLRMDVDNLGEIFQNGINKSRATLCRYAALSRLFDFFFSGYLNSIYNNCQPDYSQIIYSGGDDLFIVGSWDAMIEIAEKIRKDFSDYACCNPSFTISGGIAIVSPKFPIMNASHLSEDEERNAKNHGSNKNALSMMGIALNWDKEFPAIKDLKNKIVDFTKRDLISKSFISKIQFLAELAEIKEITKDGQITHCITNFKVYWLLAYDLKRMSTRSDNNSETKDFIDSCIRENCSPCGTIGGKIVDTLYHPLELWAFAARWAELELRTNSII